MEQEDYLEAIYHLCAGPDAVRMSDIAKALHLRKPSVTQMMQRLSRDGCVIYRPYLPVRLTEKGRRIGRKIAEHHKVLAEFLTMLGVPPSTQLRDIHGLEHFLSPVTLRKLKGVTEFLKRMGS